MANPRHVGLTGGIGSGKSTVAAMLVDCGAVCVDTDAIARQLTQANGAALPALSAAFGPDILDAQGALNRDRMRTLVFSDVTQRKRLEGILHPLIGAQAEGQALAAGDRPVVFDVPLLADSPRWRERVSRILVVDCSEATQIARVMQRNAWSAEMVQSVIAQQTPRPQRRRVADAVMLNDGLTIEALRHEVQSLWRQWMPH
jgi:dephospho-CoA kinase